MYEDYIILEKLSLQRYTHCVIIEIYTKNTQMTGICLYHMASDSTDFCKVWPVII